VAATVVAAGVILALSYGQVILIPVALSLFLTFLLAPVVRGLQHIGIGRVAAILLVGLASYAALGGVGWILTRQAASLVRELPQYRANIREKIADIRLLGRGGGIERLQETVQEAAREAEAQTAPAKPPAPTRETVVVTEDTGWGVLSVAALLGPWLAPLSMLALVAVLVPFMLLERAFLMDKLISLMGRRRLAVTTKALDEAAERVARFVLMQTLINASYGVLVAVGLFALGLPYAALWGFLAAVLRFVPYVGPWIAAVLPVALGLAVFEGWGRPALVAALFIGLELFTNLVLETVLYAGSVGVSQVGLLVAIAFWTALWGPIGLMLATPLTVCLIVFGKHLPELRWLVVLMSDERVVAPDVGYYQRLLADNPDEAVAYLEHYGVEHPDVDVRDAIFLPALHHARRDRAAGSIGAADETTVIEAVARMSDEMDDRLAPPPVEAAAVTAVGCPARDRADEVALLMLARVAAADGVAMEVLKPALLSAEVVREIAARQPRVVVLAGVAPGGLAEIRHLCKRLEATAPRPRVLVCRWGPSTGPDEDAALRTVPVARSLAQARTELAQLARLTAPEASAA
jgi:predicted PurR-regulated permease PerM